MPLKPCASARRLASALLDLRAAPAVSSFPLLPLVARSSQRPPSTVFLHTSAPRYNAAVPKASPQDPPRNSPKGRAAFQGIEPVELAYDLVQPAKVKEGNEGQCLVICHGLLYVCCSELSGETVIQRQTGATLVNQADIAVAPSRIGAH